MSLPEDYEEPVLPDTEDDVEEGDDMCDYCMRSGIAIYRTIGGKTICSACEEFEDI